MSFSGIFNTLMLLGALQGFIMCGILFFSTKNQRPNKLLGTLILLIALACLNMYLVGASWITSSSIIRFVINFVPLVIIMPIGPLLYFYVKSVTTPDFRLTRKEGWHFLPVILDIVPQLAAGIFVTGVLTGWMKNNPHPWGIFIDTYNVYADIPRWLSITVYLWLAAKLLSGFNLAEERLNWMQQLIRLFLVFQVIWLLYLVPYVVPQLTDRLLDLVDWYPVYIPLVGMIYYLGIKGILMPERVTKAPAPLSGNLIETAVPLLKKAMEEDQLYLNPANGTGCCRPFSSTFAIRRFRQMN